jgi:anthranilate synthase component I
MADMSSVLPDFAEFKRLARQGNVIPVIASVVADLVSPVAAYLKLANPYSERDHPHSFLLESVEGGERIARYTYFGADPFQTVACRGRRIAVEGRGRRQDRQEESGSVFDYLRETGRRYRAAVPAGSPPFSAGAVGYVAYEAVRQLEHLPPRSKTEASGCDREGRPPRFMRRASGGAELAAPRRAYTAGKRLAG